jgi:hypothetical protein
VLIESNGSHDLDRAGDHGNVMTGVVLRLATAYVQFEVRHEISKWAALSSLSRPHLPHFSLASDKGGRVAPAFAATLIV